MKIELLIIFLFLPSLAIGGGGRFYE